MANEFDAEEWLQIQRSAIHVEIALQVSSRRYDRIGEVTEIQRTVRDLKQDAAAKLSQIIGGSLDDTVEQSRRPQPPTSLLSGTLVGNWRIPRA